METKTNETTAPRAPRKTRKVLDTYRVESSPPVKLEGKTLSNSRELYEACADFRGDEQENFFCFDLDSRGRILARRLIGKGTVDTVIAEPKDVFRQSLRNGASVVALVHNHPAGEPEPSQNDKIAAARMRAAGMLIGIPVVDQLVVSAGGFKSIHETIDATEQNLPAHLRKILDLVAKGDVDIRLELDGQPLDFPALPAKPKGPAN